MKKYPEGPYSQEQLSKWEPLLSALQDEMFRLYPTVPKRERDIIIAEEWARLTGSENPDDVHRKITREDVQRALNEIERRVAERHQS